MNTNSSKRTVRYAAVCLAVIAVFPIGSAFTLVSSGQITMQDLSQGIHGFFAADAASTPFTASLQNAIIEGDKLQAEICMDMPTLDPWNPYASITIGDVVVPNDQVILVNAKDPKVMASKYRCYVFSFPITDKLATSQTAVLKIEKLWVEVGRGLLTDDVLPTVKSRVQQKYPTLDFEVIQTSGEQGGGAAIKILSKPADVSDQSVLEAIRQAMINEIPEAWLMQIDINP